MRWLLLASTTGSAGSADAHDVVAAEDAVDHLLTRPDPPTALFTLNNRITADALRALQRARLQGRIDARDAGRGPTTAPGRRH